MLRKLGPVILKNAAMSFRLRASHPRRSSPTMVESSVVAARDGALVCWLADGLAGTLAKSPRRKAARQRVMCPPERDAIRHRCITKDRRAAAAPPISPGSFSRIGERRALLGPAKAAPAIWDE